MFFQDLCSKLGSTEEVWRNCEILVFNESTDNSNWNHLDEPPLKNYVGTGLGKQTKYFILNKSYQE